ncbi:MAG: heat-inducible transcriptional repressor HrcA [Chromatiales bacterium 21-64-14]|nr:MAG: heat-inducible transcriptional repressor HrcA [Chromatiales bacterium 21-64-14]
MGDRAQQVLKALVEHYISQGEPVGSRTLSRNRSLDLSSATIRNVMADLEDLGYVQSPHTSAGRIPTVRGYRFFVDALLTVRSLESEELEALRHSLATSGAGRTEDVLAVASGLLSAITRMAGVVTLPRPGEDSLRHVEFLPLSGKRVLAILVVNEANVENRIIHTERAYSASELEQAAHYLNQNFAGKGMDGVRRQLIREMGVAREHMDRIMRTAVDMAEKAFTPTPQHGDYVLAGQNNLMEFNELTGSVGRLRQLFEAFTQKREILHLLDQCAHADGVQIFIGEESGYQVLDECSVVTAPYSVDGRVLGVLGVIGPTRMAYERVIPLVDATAKLLSAALNPR